MLSLKILPTIADFLDFDNKATELISFLFHIINVMKNSTPVYDNFTPEIEFARICTLGMASIEDNEETMLFEIEYPKEKTYYYLIPEETLKKDIKLMKKIIKIEIPWKKIINLIVNTILVCLILFFIKQYNIHILLLMLFGFFIYLLLLSINKVIDSDQARLICSLSPKKLNYIIGYFAKS